MNELPDIHTPIEGTDLHESLQAKALETIRELSSRIWTDYAPHDPGITILDVLNYALTELDYQMKFPLEYYLSKPDNRFDPPVYGLFGPSSVFSMNPVTFDDYQNKLLDASNGLLDVQIHPFTPGSEACGWFDLFIELSSFIPDEQREQEEEIVREKVKKLYHENRNLGEGLHEIHLIHRKPLFLAGKIDIDGSLSPEKTLIALYAEAMKLFAPGSLYTGRTLPVYKLFKGIKNIPGVLSVQSLEFEGLEEDERAYTLALSSPSQVKIQLFQNQRAVEIDLKKVVDRVHARNNLRHAIRDPKKTSESIVMDGRHIRLNNYSVLNDFPICYKDSPTDSFKEYLAIFDQLLAEGQAEINHLQDWMSLDMDLPASPSMRKNKDLLLDTLDRIYGENSNLPFLRQPDEGANRRRRVRFLRQLPELVHDRYTGINLLDADSTSGLERYCRAILGWEGEDERIYVIENLLLYAPTFSGTPILPREFALSVVIPQTEQTKHRLDLRLRIGEFLRERIPAHLRFTLYWIQAGEMAVFRYDYEAWRKALAGEDPSAIYRQGERLAEQLKHIDNQTQN